MIFLFFFFLFFSFFIFLSFSFFFLGCSELDFFSLDCLTIFNQSSYVKHHFFGRLGRGSVLLGDLFSCCFLLCFLFYHFFTYFFICFFPCVFSSFFCCFFILFPLFFSFSFFFFRVLQIRFFWPQLAPDFQLKLLCGNSFFGAFSGRNTLFELSLPVFF